jgi:hypothetical protein
MAHSRLGSLLVKEGLLTESDRRTVRQISGQGGAAFARGILAMGLLDEGELASFLAEKTRYKLAKKDLFQESNQEAWSVFDAHLLEFLEVFPLKKESSKIYVAMVDPLDLETINQLEFFSELKVYPVIATQSQIRSCLQRMIQEYHPQQSRLENFISNHAPAASRRLSMRENITLPKDIADQINALHVATAHMPLKDQLKVISPEDAQKAYADTLPKTSPPPISTFAADDGFEEVEFVDDDTPNKSEASIDTSDLEDVEESMTTGPSPTGVNVPNFDLSKLDEGEELGDFDLSSEDRSLSDPSLLDSSFTDPSLETIDLEDLPSGDLQMESLASDPSAEADMLSLTDDERVVIDSPEESSKILDDIQDQELGSIPEDSDFSESLPEASESGSDLEITSDDLPDQGSPENSSFDHESLLSGLEPGDFGSEQAPLPSPDGSDSLILEDEVPSSTADPAQIDENTSQDDQMDLEIDSISASNEAASLATANDLDAFTSLIQDQKPPLTQELQNHAIPPDEPLESDLETSILEETAPAEHPPPVDEATDIDNLVTLEAADIDNLVTLEAADIDSLATLEAADIDNLATLEESPPILENPIPEETAPAEQSPPVDEATDIDNLVTLEAADIDNLVTLEETSAHGEISASDSSLPDEQSPAPPERLEDVAGAITPSEESPNDLESVPLPETNPSHIPQEPLDLGFAADKDQMGEIPPTEDFKTDPALGDSMSPDFADDPLGHEPRMLPLALTPQETPLLESSEPLLDLPQGDDLPGDEERDPLLALDLPSVNSPLTMASINEAAMALSLALDRDKALEKIKPYLQDWKFLQGQFGILRNDGYKNAGFWTLDPQTNQCSFPPSEQSDLLPLEIQKYLTRLQEGLHRITDLKANPEETKAHHHRWLSKNTELWLGRKTIMSQKEILFLFLTDPGVIEQQELFEPLADIFIRIARIP